MAPDEPDFELIDGDRAAADERREGREDDPGIARPVRQRAGVDEREAIGGERHPVADHQQAIGRIEAVRHHRDRAGQQLAQPGGERRGHRDDVRRAGERPPLEPRLEPLERPGAAPGRALRPGVAVVGDPRHAEASRHPGGDEVRGRRRRRADDRRDAARGEGAGHRSAIDQPRPGVVGERQHVAVGPVRGARERPAAGEHVLGLERLEGARTADRFDGAGGERMPGAIGRGEVGLRRIAGGRGAAVRRQIERRPRPDGDHDRLPAERREVAGQRRGAQRAGRLSRRIPVGDQPDASHRAAIHHVTLAHRQRPGVTGRRDRARQRRRDGRRREHALLGNRARREHVAQPGLERPAPPRRLRRLERPLARREANGVRQARAPRIAQHPLLPAVAPQVAAVEREAGRERRRDRGTGHAPRPTRPSRSRRGSAAAPAGARRAAAPARRQALRRERLRTRRPRPAPRRASWPPAPGWSARRDLRRRSRPAAMASGSGSSATAPRAARSARDACSRPARAPSAAQARAGPPANTSSASAGPTSAG